MTIRKVNGIWNWTGYTYTPTGWTGMRTEMNDQFQPSGSTHAWPGSLYYEGITTHRLPNGNIMTMGRSVYTSPVRFLYFLEQDTDGTLLSAHRWVDSSNTLTTVDYAHAYNSDGTRLLVYYQNLTFKFVVCFDPEGELLWSRQLQFGNMAYRSIAHTSDGGWALLGETSSTPEPTYGFDFIIVKLDSLGVVEWTRRYGLEHRDEISTEITENADGGLSITGYSFPDTAVSNVPIFGCVLRLGATGDLLWSQVLSRPDGTGRTIATSVAELPDQTILCAGYYSDSVTTNDDQWMFLLRFDAAGNLLDSSGYGVGGTYEQIRDPKIFDIGATHVALHMEYLNSTSNGIQILVTNADLHAPCNASVFEHSVQPLSFTEIAQALSSPVFSMLVRDTLIQSDTTYMIANQNVCTFLGQTEITPPIQPTLLLVAGQIRIDPGPFNPFDLRVYDAVGRLLMSTKVPDGPGPCVLALPSAANGILLYELREAGGSVFRGKLFDLY